MLEDIQHEERTGYKAEIAQETKKKVEEADAYQDDFDDDIEEELPEDNHLLESHGDGQYPNRNPPGESLGGVTMSQSLGVDPSVDSLALEDYDHIEPVERIS